MFDNLCYYKQMRPEEALARAKVITYVLKRLREHPPATAKTNKILNAFVQTVGLFKKKNADEGLKMGVAVVPMFPKEFAEAIQMINNESKGDGDAMTKLAFSEIIDLMQKSSGDKKISKAIEHADNEIDSYETYTSGWMEMFEKINTQNKEIEAVEALLSLKSLTPDDAEVEEDEFEDEQDIERYEAAAAMLAASVGDNTQGASMESDEYESDEGESDGRDSRKRQRTSGGSRRHRKRLPKRRTVRKRSSSKKTLTQVLKELTLGI
jgi:hypothetical protein